VLALAGVIVFTIRHTRPVYASRGTLAQELRKHAPEAAAVLIDTDSTPMQRFLASEKFRDEKRNFYEDLMRTKQVDSARADSIATYAVREGYIRGISPAIIFGVMLTENARFISGALSNVGAVGLMQVYPKVWLKKQFTDSLGKDLASDSTNVRFGVFILSEYFNPRTGSGARRSRDFRTALLRYNGCVRGSNTPHCKNYPDKVKQYVEASATSICNGRGFYECIAKPFVEGLFGEAPTASQ
jgi:soluble lytic murein transglycosylase-like protein